MSVALAEDRRDLREAVARERARVFEARDAGERRLDREGDLLLDLDRRERRRDGVDLHLVVGDVGHRVDRQPRERPQPHAAAATVSISTTIQRWRTEKAEVHDVTVAIWMPASRMTLWPDALVGMRMAMIGLALAELRLEDEGVRDGDRLAGIKTEDDLAAASSRPSTTSRFSNPSSVRTNTTCSPAIVCSAVRGTTQLDLLFLDRDRRPSRTSRDETPYRDCRGRRSTRALRVSGLSSGLMKTILPSVRVLRARTDGDRTGCLT